MKFLFKGFIFRIVYTAAGFIVSLLIAKFAGTDRFGILSLMIVNAAIIQIVTGLGTDASIVWHGISGSPGEKNKIFSFTVYTTLLQLFLFVVTAFLYFRYSGKTILSGEIHKEIFYVEFLYFAGIILTEKYSSLFYSHQQAALCNKLLAIVSSALLLILLISGLFLPGLLARNPVWVFAFFVFVPGVVLMLFYQVKYKPVLIKINRGDINSFVSFSMIVLVTNLIQFLAYRTDFWIIDYFHGKGDVGVYSQASRFAQILWIIPGVLAGLIIPSLKNEKKKMSDKELISVCRLLFFTHLVMAVLLIILAVVIYMYFLPVDFFKGFSALLIMMPGYLFFTITAILAAYFSANRKLRINLLGSLFCFILILGLDLLLIPGFSFTGAAMANMVAYTLTTAFFIAVSHRRTGIAAKEFFMIRKSDLQMISAIFIKKNAE